MIKCMEIWPQILCFIIVPKNKHEKARKLENQVKLLDVTQIIEEREKIDTINTIKAFLFFSTIGLGIATN